METYKLRPYTRSDADAVVDVINASALKTAGFPRAVLDSAGNLWAYRFIPSSSEKIVAVDAEDHIIGYAYFIGKDDNIVGEMGLSTHPDCAENEIGAALIKWAEECAYEASQTAPQNIRTVLQTTVYEPEQEIIRLLRTKGYALAREWVHLITNLNRPPVVPALASPFTLREMDLDNDWDLVGPAMDEAYADHWGAIPAGSYDSIAQESVETNEADGEDALEDSSYSNSPGYCFIVLDGDTVAGGILCNARLVEREDTGRVGSLFVRPRYRRQGIAKTLMLAAFDAFWKNGFRRVITDTDARSFTDAPKLYESVGMKPYRREFTFEKEIRPGREVRLIG